MGMVRLNQDMTVISKSRLADLEALEAADSRKAAKPTVKTSTKSPAKSPAASTR